MKGEEGEEKGRFGMVNGDGGDERGKRGIGWIQYFPSLESDSYIDETLPEFSHKNCITIMFLIWHYA